MDQFTFQIEATDGAARAGSYATPHGELETPLFAPVGTQATVKALTPDQLQKLDTSLLLANTYHLYLRPGDDLVAEMGGLHDFMNWPRPILTDSGGFQVFSLARQRKIDEDGVTFRSHLDGSEHRFTPEKAIGIQENLGADIIMAFDECPEPYDRAYNEEAMTRTHDWASRCVEAKSKEDQALFGIIQGGIFPDLRVESAQTIAGLDLPGIAIGGLSVGETKEEMLATLDVLEPELPRHVPRYLMGVGSPEDLVEGVLRGIDMFDCVLPTRMARNDAAMTRTGRMNLRKNLYARDRRPIDETCNCYTCTDFSRSYIRHLIVSKEILAASLLSIHNLHTLIQLSADLRAAIQAQNLVSFADSFRAGYQKHHPAETIA